MTTAFKPTELDTDLIDLALREDLSWPFRDLTAAALLRGGPKDEKPRTGTFYSKHQTPIVICGQDVIQEILRQITFTFHYESKNKDGTRINSGDVIGHLTDTAFTLVMVERVILNFMRHLSGIATLTSHFAEKIKHTPCKVLDTRKTTPGLRHMAKYAVACGGGVNHRMGLFDAILIKNNHIDYLGGIEAALTKFLDRGAEEVPVIVEVRNEKEIDCVLAMGKGRVHRLLLDNMTTEALKGAVKKIAGRFETEASGNITLETVQAIAETGVDFVSVGMITHSAPCVDISMRMET